MRKVILKVVERLQIRRLAPATANVYLWGGWSMFGFRQPECPKELLD